MEQDSFDEARFELRARLGRGGMGTVQRAFDRLHGREVALKIGLPLDGDRDAARIGEEFALLANLDHTGLVRVLDFGIGRRAAWLTSEIVSGPRLDVWASRAQSDEALIAVARDLLETLAWLHARGLVHGDVKPANVLVGSRGPVLIDFGLAGSGGTLFGATRAYAAPELLTGGGASAASDLFALGRTLARLGKVRPPAIEALVEALTAERAADRATVAEALELLGLSAEAVRGLTPSADLRAPWAGAIERALRALEAAPLELRIARAQRGGFLGALAARLMLAGRPAWVLPEGGGLAPFARIAAALGASAVAPADAHTEDHKEVLDAFTDRLIDALGGVATAHRPVLLVPDSDALGGAGRFVLARLIEARALPGFAVVGGEHALERGMQGALTRLEVLASEAAGRDWAREWAALSASARRAARELFMLGGAARLDELTAGDDAATRRAWLDLLASVLTQRAPAGRTALQPDVMQAMQTVLALEPAGDDERRRWLTVLARADAPGEAMLRARARHAAALGEGPAAIEAFLEAAREAEAAFAWARAAEDRIEAAGWALTSGDGVRAFEEARSAFNALAAAGGGPRVEAALALAERAVAAAGASRLGVAVAVLRARAALSLGRGAEAIAAASEVLSGEPDAWKVRFEALLARGTALSQTDDKAGAERDLGEAAALAEAEGDLHALGRTANNLGMLAFHRGDLEVAAAAWARAADAKARTGDRRGERIGRHNRGLALRELGRLAEASEAANEAAALSERIGDQVGRATAALANAQLALDRGQIAQAEAALASFAQVGWKPAMVDADGRLVQVRLLIAKGALADAERAVREALQAAIAARLEPVAAEAWALLQVITGRASEVPELVLGALERASHERGGLALLLLFARVSHEAEAGLWDRARAGLGQALARLREAPLPPAARLALPLVIAAARLVDPEAAASLEALAAADGDGAARRSMADHGALTEVGPMLGDGMPHAGDGVADLAGWARRLRKGLNASRVEIVPLEGEATVDAQDGHGAARFVALGRRVAAGSEAFVARAEERAQAVAVPLLLGGRAIGALAAGFDGVEGKAEALTAKASAGTLEVLALALAHEGERRRRERAEAEVTRLDAALRQHVEQHEAEVTALRDALEQSQSVLSLRYDYGHIVHRSAAMKKILETLDKVTDRELPVLILGESGVGKELLARALHFNGPRAKKRFMAENCGAIPKDLFESQFFGHLKGAFTGALTQRQGLFEAAEGGTLFLDEIGELPLDMQVKLLRVLQDKKVRPVGSNREIPVDFRLVCATNRDLGKMVQEGRFREDLFYRIAVVKLDVPPLRKRPEDILPIADKLLAMHAERLARTVRLAPDAAERLAAYPFPGNVRELDNELLRALALSEGTEIRARHLSAAINGRSEPRRRGADGSTTEADGDALDTLESAFARVEKELLLKHLRASRGQKLGAAKSLGLSRPGLDAKLARHGIDARELARTLKEPRR